KRSTMVARLAIRGARPAQYRTAAGCLPDPARRFHWTGGASRRNRTTSSRRPGAAYRRLVEDLQIGDDVVDILGIGHSAVGHAVALHLRLRVLDIGAQIVVVPNKVRAPHRIRVAEILKRCRLAPENAFE